MLNVKSIVIWSLKYESLDLYNLFLSLEGLFEVMSAEDFTYQGELWACLQ